MYLEAPEDISALTRSLKRRIAKTSVQTVLCPPLPFIAAVARSGFEAGAQDVSLFDEGAYTGEVSARMAKNAGASYALIGHSERRALGEGDDAVAQKLLRAAEAKLVPILCVGEKERNASGSHFVAIEEQLRSALQSAKKKMPPMVIAYEPVWAIGKRAEDAMKPAELQETVLFIRKTIASLYGRKAGLATPVLYGGSVEAGNAEELSKEGGIQGFLVGRASADPAQLASIIKIVSK